MADYVRIEVTTRRIRYELQSPSNHVKLAKALSAAGRSFEEIKGRPPTFDDDLDVTAEGDVLVVSFEATR